MNTITTRFHSPTNHRGSRISATHTDGKRIYVDWDHTVDSQTNHEHAARVLCGKDWRGYLACGDAGPTAYVWVLIPAPLVEVQGLEACLIKVRMGGMVGAKGGTK
jgi:hypothetical protein